MKRYIHASDTDEKELVAKEKLLDKYSSDQIALVEQCRNEMLEEYDHEEISEIHYYWLNKAIDEGILDEDSFDDIYGLLDDIDLEEYGTSIIQYN